MSALASSGFASSRAARSRKGWTPERRARQAERARLTQPWRHSTGPKTEAGKARVAMNAFRHGYRGRAWLLRARRIRNAIRLCADTVLLARVRRSLGEGGRALSLLTRGEAAAAQPITPVVPARDAVVVRACPRPDRQRYTCRTYPQGVWSVRPLWGGGVGYDSAILAASPLSPDRV